MEDQKVSRTTSIKDSLIQWLSSEQDQQIQFTTDRAVKLFIPK